jgi:CRP-like cAMP-binding protein
MENFDLSQLQNLLKKSPKSRTLQNLKKIQSYLKTISFFDDLRKDLPPEQLTECLKTLYSSVFSGNETICKKGEIVEKVFILIHGKVVFEDSNCNIFKSFDLGMIITETLITNESINFDIKSFSASTVLVFFLKDDYKRLLGKYREEKKMALANFLTVQKSFISWRKGLILTLVSDGFFSVFEKGETVFLSLESPSQVFILFEGELMLVGKNVSRIDTVQILGFEEVKNNEKFSNTCIATRKSKLLTLFKHDALKIISLMNNQRSPLKTASMTFQERFSDEEGIRRQNNRQRFLSTAVRWASRVSLDSMVSYSSISYSGKRARKVAVRYTSVKQL